MIVRRAQLRIVPRGFPAGGTRNGVMQLLANRLRVRPVVSVLERLAEEVFGPQAGRGERGPVGLDEDALGRHQSHEHRRPQPVDEIAQAPFALLGACVRQLMLPRGDVGSPARTMQALHRHANDHAGQRAEQLFPVLAC